MNSELCNKSIQAILTQAHQKKTSITIVFRDGARQGGTIVARGEGMSTLVYGASHAANFVHFPDADVARIIE